MNWFQFGKYIWGGKWCDFYITWLTMSFGEFDWTCSDKYGQVMENQAVELEEEHQGKRQETRGQRQDQSIRPSGHQGILSISNEERFSNLGLWFLCDLIIRHNLYHMMLSYSLFGCPVPTNLVIHNIASWGSAWAQPGPRVHLNLALPWPGKPSLCKTGWSKKS